jgi:hypothetical protein
MKFASKAMVLAAVAAVAAVAIIGGALVSSGGQQLAMAGENKQKMGRKYL